MNNNFQCCVVQKNIYLWKRQRILILILSIRSNGDQMNTQLLILHWIPISTPPYMDCNSAMFPRLIYEPLSNVLWCVVPKAGSSTYRVTYNEVAERVMLLLLLLCLFLLLICLWYPLLLCSAYVSSCLYLVPLPSVVPSPVSSLFLPLILLQLITRYTLLWDRRIWYDMKERK